MKKIFTKFNFKYIVKRNYGGTMKVSKKILITALIVLLVTAFSYIIYLKINPKIAVLCYHNVATAEEKANYPDESDWVITVENFEEQLKYLQKAGYKTLTTKEFYEWKQGKIDLPHKSVLITFDDGFLSNLHYAFPLLKKYNMNATVFVAGEFVENSDEERWTGNVKTYIKKEDLDIIRKEYPNIEICSHSYMLHKQGAINQEKDVLTQDMNNFNSNIQQTTIYAYPFGQYNDNMIEALKDTNYKLAFIYGPTSKEYRKASRQDDDYKIPRLNVSHGMEIPKFALRLLMPF